MTYASIRYRFLIAILALLPAAGLFGQQDTAAGEFENIEAIINNETAINSDRLEFSPAFYENGIVFISTRLAGRQYKVMDKDIRTNIMSIFIARRDANGQLQAPVPFAQSLLSTVHEGPLTFSPQNDVIYFTRNNINEKGKPQKASDGKNKLKIYSATKSGPIEWTNVRDLPFNSSEFNTAHPSISVEGDRLYFASDRPGGLGGMDLYVVNKDGAAWGAPVNLGPEINTPGNELFPFIHADGTLFFTSDARDGKGGMDIYYSVMENGAWSNPVNFELLNSVSDDFGMIIDRDKKNGYFSSNRAGGLGEDDIYRFFVLGDLRQVPEEEDVAEDFMVQVNDNASGLPLEGADIKGLLLDQFTILKAITLADRPMERDEILLRIPFDESASQGATNAAGGYTVRLEPGSHIFKITKPGYQTKRVVVNTGELEGKVIYVNLNEGTFSPDDEEVVDTDNRPIDWSLPELIDSGTVFQLPNIYYNFNDASIRPDARTDLDYLADFMLKFPDIQIELASHTDSRGSEVYNLNLSQERAENAAQYLVTRGVNQDRIIPVGYGETRLRNDCVDNVPCSEAKHQFNRRTEVRILKMGDPINLTIVNEITEPSVIDYPDLLTDISEGERMQQGRYQVVAGSFKSEANAETRLTAVQALGYTSARVTFNPSNDLHVVLVDVFQFKSDALELVERLKADGMECFLKVQ